MKRLLMLFACAMFLSAGNVNAQDLPQPSPKSSVNQRVGLTDFTVTYSRPSVKGRQIFGDLIPYGQLWRTGANMATTVEFNTPVHFGGKEVPAGKYSFFTIPNQDKWTVILNKNANLGGTSGYSEKEDIVRFDVPAKKGEKMESMLIYFDNLTDGSADMVLAWENMRINVPLKVEFADMAEANIEAKLKELESSFAVYNNAARYYIENGKDAKQALGWAEKSVKGKETFWNTYTYSLAQAANSDFKGAIKTANRSMELAKEADVAAYVKMNEENIKKWSSSNTTGSVPATKAKSAGATK